MQVPRGLMAATPRLEAAWRMSAVSSAVFVIVFSTSTCRFARMTVIACAWWA